MSTVLITGGAGFVGSHLADRLLSMRHKVSVIDNLSTGRVIVFPAISHGAHLARANRCFITRIKKKHNNLAVLIRKTPVPAVGVQQRKIRCGATFSYCL